MAARLSLLLPFLICVLGVTAQAAETRLRIGGTGAALGVMSRLAAAFAEQEPGVAVEVLPSLGSSGGIRALGEGAIDIAVSARPLKPEEAAAGLRSAPLSRTPFVMVSSRAPASGETGSGFAAGALAGFYAAPAATWPDGTPLRVILRPRSDSDSAFLERHFPGMAEALAAARSRPGVPVAQTDQENFVLAGDIEGSLTTATLTQVVTENPQLTPIPIDGVAPTLENLENGGYPYFKDMIIAHRADSRPAALGFLAFIASPQGRRILRDAGNLPLL